MSNQQISSLLMVDSNSSKDSLPGVAGDATVLSLSIDLNDNVLFVGSFVPPPPRPLFLEDGITPDGLTTCDLCSWAWRGSNSNFVDNKLESSSELGWIFTLIIVSLTSAVLGAIIMIVVLHFKRLRKTRITNRRDVELPNIQSTPNRPPVGIPDDKMTIPSHFPSNESSMNGVWSWLSRRSTTSSSQLESHQLPFVENHYTHMEDPYNGVDQALYAELDIENDVNKDNSQTYQNSAYTDSDAPASTAPSSAYYSDLSITTCTDRTYEVVGLSTLPLWDLTPTSEAKKAASGKLAVISETVGIPSDYV